MFLKFWMDNKHEEHVKDGFHVCNISVKPAFLDQDIRQQPLSQF